MNEPQFGGHEFSYESHTDLFRCVRCAKYEVTVRGDDGKIEECSGELPEGIDPLFLNAF